MLLIAVRASMSLELDGLLGLDALLGLDVLLALDGLLGLGGLMGLLAADGLDALLALDVLLGLDASLAAAPVLDALLPSAASNEAGSFPLAGVDEVGSELLADEIPSTPQAGRRM